MDPRKPQRPDGDAGSNWCVCNECGRQGKSARAIQHRKGCALRRNPITPVSSIFDFDEGFDSWRELNVMD